MGPQGPKNGPFRAMGGKKPIGGCNATKILVVSPIGTFRIDYKRPSHDPFFAENLFSPADESVFMGLVVRSGDGVLRALAG